MRQLGLPELTRVLPLVPPSHEAGHMTFVHAVLEGTMPGRAFVDDIDQTRAAIVCNDSGWCFALGEPLSEFANDAVPQILQTLGNEYTSLFATTAGWETVLDDLLERATPRNEYHFGGLPPGTYEPPGGYRLVALDAHIAEMFEGRVDPWVVRIWGGPERFAEKAFGFAVMRGDELASFCSVCAIGGGEAEVEIGTAHDSRGLGLATVAGAAFIRECQRRGLRPAWTCTSDNAPSDRLACRLGFSSTRQVARYVLGRTMRLEQGRWRLPE